MIWNDTFQMMTIIGTVTLAFTIMVVVVHLITKNE